MLWVIWCPVELLIVVANLSLVVLFWGSHKGMLIFLYSPFPKKRKFQAFPRSSLSAFGNRMDLSII